MSFHRRRLPFNQVASPNRMPFSCRIPYHFRFPVILVNFSELSSWCSVKPAATLPSLRFELSSWCSVTPAATLPSSIVALTLPSEKEIEMAEIRTDASKFGTLYTLLKAYPCHSLLCLVPVLTPASPGKGCIPGLGTSGLRNPDTDSLFKTAHMLGCWKKTFWQLP